MPIRAVVFDLDNTLIFEDEATFSAVRAACVLARERAGIDADRLAAETIEHAAALWRAAPEFAYGERFGIWWGEALWGDFDGPYDAARAMRRFAPGFRRSVWQGSLARLHVADAGLAEALAAEYIRIRRASEHIDPAAEPVLVDLARRYRLALLSNGAGDVQREKLSRTPFERYFATIVISVEEGVGKPDPRIFRIALQRVDVDPGEAVMVGDSLARDVAGAKAAGMMAVWIDRGLWSGEVAVPDATILALSELPAALDALAPARASPRGSP